MYYIGLDPSTKLGYAEITMQDVATPVIEDSAVLTATRKCEGVARALNITDQVMERLPPVKEVGLIAIEGYSFASAQGLLYVVEIGTILRYQLFKTGYPLLLCAPSTLKKFVTGKGNSDKKRMILDAHKRWAFDLSDDNECDAACLAVIAAAHAGAYHCGKAMGEDAKKLMICT